MDIDTVLIDLNVISQLQENDKLGVNKLLGKQELVIYSGKKWFQGTYRWYYNTGRSDVLAYLHDLVKKVETHADLFTEPVTQKTNVLRQSLKNYTSTSLNGIQHLINTYSSDNYMVAQLLLIQQKLEVSQNKILVENKKTT